MSDQKSVKSFPTLGRSLLGMGVLVFLVMLAGTLVFRLVSDDEEIERAPSLKHEPVQLTAQQEANLPNWGRKIASMICDDQGEELSQMHDYGAVAELALAGTDGKEVRRMLDRMIRSAVTHKAGGFIGNAVGHPARFLRVCTRAGFPAVTLRVTYENDLFAYLDVLLQPVGEQFKIVDVYDYFTGDCRTEGFRVAMVPFLITQNSQAVSKWLENWHMQKGDAEYLVSLLEARAKGVDEDILTVCDQAPEALRSNKIVFFTRCRSLQQLSLTNARYDRLYFQALEQPPPMPDTPHMMEMLLIPKLLAAADYQTADDAVAKVMAVIGEDAYLLCLRAQIKLHLMDKEAARDLLRQAWKLEPDLPLLQEMRQTLQFSPKNDC